MTDAETKYADIIHLPHHTSPTRPRMSECDRAAQFSPFAALTGYDAAVSETGRLTEIKAELSEDEKSILNEKIQMILDHLDREPFVTVTYFVPDAKKAGGAYVEAAGVVRQIDEYERTVVVEDGTQIPIRQIRSIEGDMFGGGGE